MPSVAAQIGGYIVLAAAVAAMAIGAAGIFSRRLTSVVIYSGVVQGGYLALGLAAGLLTADRAGFHAAVFQALAGGAGVGLMWLAARALVSVAGDTAPLAPDAAPAAWAVFSFVLACMSLAGLPPLAGLPAKVAIIHAGLRAPGVLFLATLGAAALGAVTLWAYGVIALPLIGNKVTTAPASARVPVRVLVDALVAVLILLGVVPYVGFAIAGAIGGR